MSVTITPLLAERLNISEERTRSLLKSMLQELRRRAESEGVQLSELGTFREEEGTLTFVPSDSLRRRVNHQFEGLSPEDLAAPPSGESDAETPPTLRESPDEADQADSSPEQPPPSDEPSPPEEAPDPGPPEDESTPTTESGEQEDEPSSSPASEEPVSPSQTPDASEDTTEREEESIPTLDPIEDENGHGPAADETGPEDDSEEPPSPPEEEEQAEEEEPRSFSLIGSLLLIVLLGVVGWFVYSETNLWTSEERTAPYESSETTQPAAPSSKDQGSESAPDANEPPDDAQPERYPGVKPGDENEQAASPPGTGNWTIVVASRTSRAEAEAMTNTYEDRFDNVNVVRGTVNNTTWYRVTVGQYNSEAAAESALHDHASALPGDAWTHQLR